MNRHKNVSESISTRFQNDPLSGGRRTVMRRVGTAFLGVLLFLGLILQNQVAARAQAELAIETITWNTIGLDAENVNAGPDTFPVGVRVCNQGDAPAANVLVEFVWDTTSEYISLEDDSPQSLTTLPVDTCQDFYFTVVVDRSSEAYGETARYHITALADGIGQVSTPMPREIFVEELTSRSGLATTSITGPTQVMVGSTYQYVVESSMSQPEYQQLVHFLDFPADLFHLDKVSAVYSNPPGTENDTLYADPCVWRDNPAEPSTYRTCTNVNGVIGGTAVVTYTVTVLAPGEHTVKNILYGLARQAQEFQYNSNLNTQTLAVVAQVPAQTSTPTLTPTRTSTVPAVFLPEVNRGWTNTPTLTSTPVSPTVTATFTGTINPNPAATKEVSAGEVRVNQAITFTIRVRNNGQAPALSMQLVDNLSSYLYLDIYEVDTTKGTRTFTARSATVSIGTLMPNEEVVVTIRVRVNSTATGSASPCNYATINYTGGSRTTNSQCFRVIGSTVLPGTGEHPLNASPNALNWPVVLLSAALAAAGLLALVFALVDRVKKNHWPVPYLVLGVFLSLGAGFVYLSGSSLTASGPRVEKPAVDLEAEVVLSEVDPADLLPQPTETVNPLAVNPVYTLITPEFEKTLPSFPIPSPTLRVTPGPDQKKPDASAVKQLSIPALGLTAKVAYVPFDGHTWLIEGLRDEIAWMGNTSWPGLGGNTGLAGHVTVRQYGEGPFRYLNNLVRGDTVTLYTEENAYTYRVSEKKTVDSTDLSVLEQKESSQITLITCVDWHDQWEIYLNRLVVVADLVTVEPLSPTAGY